MRQRVPHRVNICLRRNKCKIFVGSAAPSASSVIVLSHRKGAPVAAGDKMLMRNNGLYVYHFRPAKSLPHYCMQDTHILHGARRPFVAVKGVER